MEPLLGGNSDTVFSVQRRRTCSPKSSPWSDVDDRDKAAAADCMLNRVQDTAEFLVCRMNVTQIETSLDLDLFGRRQAAAEQTLRGGVAVLDSLRGSRWRGPKDSPNESRRVDARRED